MKKFLVVLLLLVYGFSVTGTSLHLHYCCGKLHQIDFAPAKKDRCDDGHMRMKSKASCCKEKEVAFKISGEQVHVKNFLPKFAVPAFSSILPLQLLCAGVEITPFAHHRFPASPPHSSLHTLYCVFRI